MAASDFEYDVAFSFHSKDEGLANELNDLVQDRFKTFLYTQRQDVLAGTDGQETFSRVFGKKSRLVVVFARKEWGETPFTRIEQTAIRVRAFDSGFDFTLFIPTGDPKEFPPWVPPPRIYFDYERYGLSGAAAVISSRLQELGGAPRVESIADRAARYERARLFQTAKEQFDHGFEGVEQASKAFMRLVNALGAKSADLANVALNLQLTEFRKRRVQNDWMLSGLGVVLLVQWRQQYANSLANALLIVDIFDRGPSPLDAYSSEKPRRLKQERYRYALLGPNRPGYVDLAGPERTFAEDALAEHLLKVYIDTAERQGHRASD